MTVQNIFYAKRDAKKSVKLSIVKYIWTLTVCSCRNLSFFAILSVVRVVIISKFRGRSNFSRPTQCYKFNSAAFFLSMIIYLFLAGGGGGVIALLCPTCCFQTVEADCSSKRFRGASWIRPFLSLDVSDRFIMNIAFDGWEIEATGMVINLVFCWYVFGLSCNFLP